MGLAGLFRLSSLADWIDAIVALPVAGALPTRTVIVPGESVAHALRRGLCDVGRADVLVGTRFVDPVTLALEVLQKGGWPGTADEDALRVVRVRSVLGSRLELRYFQAERIRAGLGWDRAMARTVSNLERSGVTVEQLRSRKEGSGRLADLADIWEALDLAAGMSWTAARVLAEAARCLAGSADAWAVDGPALAGVAGDVDAVTARFLRAIPGIQVGLLVARPARDHYLARMDFLWGAAPHRGPLRGGPGRGRSEGDREIDILGQMLFEAPELLGAAERARSEGPDGSVTLEDHAGVEEEVEAAAEWVGRLVLEGRVALADIGLLTPRLDPLAGMLVDRLARLPTAAPAYVAGGLPVVRQVAGARVLAVLRALAGYLDIESMASLLTTFRPRSSEETHLTFKEAALVSASLGTTGGSLERPRDALRWAERLLARERDLAAQVAALPTPAPARPDDAATLLDVIGRIRPAVDALTTVAAAVVDGAALPALWSVTKSFLEHWLLLPGDGATVPAMLGRSLEPLCRDSGSAALRGHEALAAIIDALETSRFSTGRFGDPAVYIGAIASAAGLPFKAVRILGLAEGAFAAAAREDPVLPSDLAALFAPQLPGPQDRLLADVHRLGRIVRDTTDRIVFSAPRRTLDGTEHEPAFVLLEVAAALGRPDAGSKERAPIPDSAALVRTAFAPARAERREWRTRNPLTSVAWIERTAGLAKIPPSWRGNGALDLSRLRSLMAAESFGPLDGLLAGEGLVLKLPGLSPERPISASSLKILLQCPHRFLLERLLGWYGAPGAAGPMALIDPSSYGSLLHEVLEVFYQPHGAAFGRREETLAHWQKLAQAVARSCFQELLGRYPLFGEGVTEQQRQRLARDVASYLEREWQGKASRHVAVERAFGYDEPLPLAAGRRELFVRGRIDRLDCVGEATTMIQDVKSGKSNPRMGKLKGPDCSTDLQLGVYALVALKQAGAWKLPGRVGVSYEYVGRSEGSRAFVDDVDVLLQETRAWLDTAAELLVEQQFPRSPHAEDCAFCPFPSVCGKDAQARGALALESGAGGLARFRELKRKEGE
jgi:RecB family exonuclease